MKNRKIKIISFTLCLILCLSSIPAFAVSAVEQRKELLFAVDEASYNNFLSELSDPTVIIDQSQIDSYANSDIDISESIITNFDLFDYTSICNISELTLTNYKAIALPISNEETVEIARAAYN